MATTRKDIERWFRGGKARGATHIIVVCDTFSYDDYPVYVMPGENVRKEYKKYNEKDMQKVMEVYSLRMNMETQLNEYRAFHFD